MRRLLALLLLSAPVFGTGPKFVGTNTPVEIKQEFENVYHDISYPTILNATVSTMTVTSCTGCSSSSLSLVVSTLTVTSSTTLKGTTSGTGAAAGNIGEIISATAGTQALPTSNQYGDATSILLTPGNWLVYGTIYFGIGGGTWSLVETGLSTSSGNSFPEEQFGANAVFWNYANSATTPANMVINFIPVSVKITSNTTYYLKMLGTYTAGTPRAQFSTIEAVRYM